MSARKFDEEMTARAVDMYLGGATKSEIAREFGVKRLAVDRLFNRLRDQGYMNKQAVAKIQELVLLQLLKNLYKSTNIPLHNMTVLKFIHEIGLFPDLDENSALERLQEIADKYENE